MAKYISKINIRPCINKKPLFIEAGTEFEGDMLDKESLKQMIDAGTVLLVVKSDPSTAPLEEKKKNEPPPVPPEEKKAPPAPPAAAPVGIWKYKRAGIEKLGIDVLNALYKETADEAGLEVSPIDDKEELLKILCSENGEQETKG